MTNRTVPLTLASCLALPILDGCVYAATMATLAKALLPLFTLGGVVTCACVTWFEWRAGDRLSLSLRKGLVGGLAVAVPLPMVGTLLGLGCLLWRAAAHASKARSSSELANHQRPGAGNRSG